jgi:Tfp pilus assembly PilM family ATPase
VLTLQALAESAGLELAVLETSEAARLRADQWRHQQVNTQDHQAGPDVAAQELHHHVTTTALGLALRRFLPWGTAC